jgi:hypothetical protein
MDPVLYIIENKGISCTYRVYIMYILLVAYKLFCPHGHEAMFVYYFISLVQ